MRRIISLWLPGWAIDRWRRRRGAPADGPFALVATIAGARRLVAVDTAAAAAGTTTGLTLAEARARLPDLATAEAEPAPDAADLLHLAEWCRRYTPWTRPDGDAAVGGGGVLLDVTGCAALFGGEAALLDDLSRRLAQAGLAHGMAVADTPGAAWGVARFGKEQRAIVAPGAARAALAPLPVDALGLDVESVAGLRRVGLVRVGDLMALPRQPLVARFGDAVATRLDQALGLLPEPVMPLAPAPERRVRLAFAEPIATAEPIAAAARRLLDDLCPRLAAEGIGALRLALDLFRVDAAVQRLSIGTARPSRDPAHLFRLLAEKLPLAEPGFGIELAMLSLVESAPLLPETIGRLDVASPDPGGSPERQAPEGKVEVLAMAAELAPLVDRIQNRLGFSALHRPAPRASHVPERAVTAMAPFAPDPPASVPWPAAAAPRPLRLLRRPEPVDVTAPVPDDPPILFRWRSALHRVRRADGPERIAAEWWRDEAGIRDYYRVEDEAGRRFWLYRCGLHGGTDPPRWFLHGFFA